MVLTRILCPCMSCDGSSLSLLNKGDLLTPMFLTSILLAGKSDNYGVED